MLFFRSSGRAGALLATSLLVIMSLALAACGDSGDDDEAPVAPTATSAPAIRTITDSTGLSMQVPGEPKRVVTLTDHDLDATLALGITPVGVAAGRAGSGATGAAAPPAFLASRLTGVEIVTSGNEVQFEKILSLNPDIILAGEGQSVDEATARRLREIAPTVVTNKLADDWKTSFKNVATALGMTAKGESVLSDYQKKAGDVKGKIGANVGKTASIVRWNPQGPAFMLQEHFASLVLADVGIIRPVSQQKPGNSPSLVSLEALDQLDADWMFLGTLTPDAERALESARALPVFQQLNVVKSNHIVPINGSVWTSRGGPIAALAVLDDVEKALAGR